MVGCRGDNRSYRSRGRGANRSVESSRVGSMADARSEISVWDRPHLSVGPGSNSNRYFASLVESSGYNLGRGGCVSNRPLGLPGKNGKVGVRQTFLTVCHDWLPDPHFPHCLPLTSLAVFSRSAIIAVARRMNSCPIHPAYGLKWLSIIHHRLTSGGRSIKLCTESNSGSPKTHVPHVPRYGTFKLGHHHESTLLHKPSYNH